VRIQKGIKTRKNRMKDELRPEFDLGQLLKGGYVASTRRATTWVQISFSWSPMPARPFAVGGRLAVPSVYIAAQPGRVGQALPLLGDRVAQSGKLQAPRLQFERRLRSCDPEVAMVNSSLELTVGSSSKEKPTVTRGRRGDTVATRSSAWLRDAPQGLLVNTRATVAANHAFLLVSGLLIERYPFEPSLASPRNCAGS